MIKTRLWKFKVLCNLEPEERVCLIGSCESLGNWNARKLIILEEEQDGTESSTYHTVTIEIPYEEVEFRYCVCNVVEPSNSNSERKFIIKRWETNFFARKIAHGISNQDNDTIHEFGLFGNRISVDKGWLLDDTMIQLKFCKSNLYNDSLILWKKRLQRQTCRIKITPIVYDLNNLNFESFMSNEDTEETDLSIHRNTSTRHQKLVEVAVMKEDGEMFKPQEQFGVVCDNKDYIIFQCRTLHPDTIIFLIDIYCDRGENEIPMWAGCTYLQNHAMTQNYGVQTLTIQSPKQSPIGQLTVHYMVVKPMSSNNTSMDRSYARYWKDTWTGLQVGHRGAGNSYNNKPTSCANIRENTIASLKYAADQGADMVEFDVQLSRDRIPVIYHDFHACIALKQKKNQDTNDLLEMPIKDLSLHQLQSLKDLSHLNEGVPCDVLSYCDREDMTVYHVTENGESRFCDEAFEDHQPFPTLEKALETVPVACGFNIEVKWTMQMKDGSYELDHPFELNNFMDIILKLVLEKSGDRKIVFSCFHPDICTLLRVKQNKYPVLYLTQGVSTFWPEYDDELTTSIHKAVIFAKSAEILGINVHTEDIIRDPKQMDFALKNNLIVFCWGEDNNDSKTLQYLIESGMHGIIYDKIDVYNYKDEKRSIFLCDESANA